MSQAFRIVIHRKTISGEAVSGTIEVNGSAIGTTLENKRFVIPAGSYTGRLRYASHHHFVQGPHGLMARKGDFLLEVAGVPHRANILFHTGNLPRHSLGCVLLGPIKRARGPHGAQQFFAPDPLVALRLLFYGADDPVSCPDKAITVTIRNEYDQ